MSFYKQAAARRAQQMRQRRLTAIAVIGGLSVLVVGVIIVQSLVSRPNPTGALADAAQATYPQADGKALGPADAPVVVMEFADFQCPYCNMFHTDIQGRLVEQYLATGQVRFEFHHFIVIDGNVGGVESRQAAIASECANNQGQFWPFHALLFANQAGEGQGAFGATRLAAMAESLGLAMPAFNTCFTTTAAAEAVVADELLARRYALTSTPSLLINGVRVANPLDYQQVAAAMDAALAQVP